ncbi:hypothetical protein QFC20_001801 [Naganishia adeliensis]|uniref:Uncharacterized protein n=1 Tax=Naganishia adeliensis TaxID=92952 RepID=A0ACC2WRH5_9TREE|nr:hypothetical protein QFC20_001801 [Naganishia adeliensis]
MPSTSTSTGTTPVHRVRFVDYDPSPITALVFPPLPFPSADPGIAHAQQQAINKKIRTTVGTPELTPELVAAAEFGCLICARQNGQIDIWEYVGSSKNGNPGNWVLSRVLPTVLSHPTVSLASVVVKDPEYFQSPDVTWRVPRLSDLRLFTAGSDSGDIVERCLLTGRILQTYAVPGAPVWAMSAAPTQDRLAVATSSPHIHFLSISPHSIYLEPSSPVTRTEAIQGRTRTLSIAWGPPTRVHLQSGGPAETDGKMWVWRNHYLVTGNSDSSLRKWNVLNGRMIGRMAVNKLRRDQGKNRGNIVWGVGVLADHTIISSDSLGSVTFWDGKSQAQLQTFQAHAADALCLTIGSNGKSVYTAGPDQKVAQFTLVNANPLKSEEKGDKQSRGKWIQTSFKRLHVHDVRSLAMFPPYSLAPKAAPLNPAFAPILASGGLDMQVALTPASSADMLVDGESLLNPISRNHVTKFGDALQHRMGFTPSGHGTDVLGMSESKRLIMVRRYRGIGIWRLRELETQYDEAKPTGWDKVLEMNLQLRTSLTAACLSKDGNWLAVSDLYETKLFKLRYGTDGEISPKRVKDFNEMVIEECTSLELSQKGTGSATLAFTPDSHRLVLGLALEAAVVVVELPNEFDDAMGVSRTFSLAQVEGARVTRRLPRRHSVSGKPDGKNNGKATNGHLEMNGMDVDAEEQASSVDEDTPESDDEDSDDEDDEGASGGSQLLRAELLAVSEDGQWLAVADTSKKTAIYNLDALKLHCLLPTFAQPPASMCFVDHHHLALAFPVDNSIQAFDVDARKLNPDYFPKRTKMSRQGDPVVGLRLYSAGTPAKLVAWGLNWIASIPLNTKTGMRHRKKRSKRFSDAEAALDMGKEADEGDSSGAESGNEGTGDGTTSTVTGKYRQLAGVGVFGNELVVVERPFTDLRNLPQAFVVAKYAT